MARVRVESVCTMAAEARWKRGGNQEEKGNVRLYEGVSRNFQSSSATDSVLRSL